MEILKTFEFRRAGDCPAGGLVEFTFDNHPTFGVIISDGDQKIALALASKGPGFAPQFIILSGFWADSQFLFYPQGSLEIIRTDDLASEDASRMILIGAIRIAGSTLGVQAIPIVGGRVAKWFDLVANQPMAEAAYPRFYASKWRLWANSDDRNREGAEPLFEYEARAPQGR